MLPWSTFELWAIWIHGLFGKKCLLDDAKRMLKIEAVPVKTRRPLLSGAWSTKKIEFKINELEFTSMEVTLRKSSTVERYWFIACCLVFIFVEGTALARAIAWVVIGENWNSFFSQYLSPPKYSNGYQWI